MGLMFGSWTLLGRHSEALVDQIMKTIRLSRADATAMAIRMLIAELIIAADMAAPAFEETHGVA